MDFLLPIKNEVISTVEKLLNCKDNTCKFLFVKDGEEIKGSIMAAQYSDDCWIVQDLAVLPGHSLFAKDLILEMVKWNISNKGMNYMSSFYQKKTKWADSTYTVMIAKFGTQYMAIDDYCYMYAKIDDLIFSENNIGVSEMSDIDYHNLF